MLLVLKLLVIVLQFESCSRADESSGFQGNISRNTPYSDRSPGLNTAKNDWLKTNQIAGLPVQEARILKTSYNNLC